MGIQVEEAEAEALEAEDKKALINYIITHKEFKLNTENCRSNEVKRRLSGFFMQQKTVQYQTFFTTRYS